MIICSCICWYSFRWGSYINKTITNLTFLKVEISVEHTKSVILYKFKKGNNATEAAHDIYKIDSLKERNRDLDGWKKVTSV